MTANKNTIQEEESRLSIRILTDRKMMNAVQVMVAGEDNANYLADEARKAGFDNVQVGQRSGVVGTNLYHVLIRTRPNGKASEIVAFLEQHPEIEYGKDE
jgi:hypothetical protein